MNNKIIAGIVIAVIVLGGGYFLLNGKTTKNELASNTSGTSTESEVKATTETGSLKSLLAAGTSRKCSYNNEVSGVTAKGVVYVAGGKMRGDISSELNGKTNVMHMINKDSISYMWNDDGTIAFKMAFDPNAAAASANAQVKTQANAVDLEKTYSFSCESWSGDSTMFELPSDVNFTEVPGAAMPATGTSPSANNSMDSKEAQKLICNSLSGTAKEQCLSALK